MINTKALTYTERGKFALLDKPVPRILDSRDAIVWVTLGSICTSDLHIKHGSVPRAVPGITVGHEMVGVVESVGAAVKTVRPGDRVTVNVETFCGECYFCQHGCVPRAVPGIRSACTPESPFNLLRHHGKVLLCACFFTESTLEKCYDVSTQ